MATAWQQRGVAGTIIGIDRNRQTAERAVAEGLVDEYGGLEACREADLILLAVPVGEILALSEPLSAVVPEGAVVTDVGSTKSEIVTAMESALAGRASFVGGHPMAGSERGGLAAADPYLFENAIYLLTPTRSTAPESLALVQDAVRRLGAHPVLLAPGDHDAYVAVISHLPQLLAVNLVLTAGDPRWGSGAADQGPLTLAAGGFRDTTRIADSPPELWDDIFRTNRGSLLAAIERFQSGLDRLADALGSDDFVTIRERMEQARQLRSNLPRHRRDLMPRIHDLVIVLPDRPGALGRVATLLGDAGLDIRDVEILHVREGEGGTIRFSFASDDAVERAARLLERHGYGVRRGDAVT